MSDRWSAQDLADLNERRARSIDLTGGQAKKRPKPDKPKKAPKNALTQQEYKDWKSHALIRRLHHEYGYPMAEREYRFHPVRRWKFDYAYPEYQIAIEIEGGAWIGGRHVRGKGYISDMEKYNEATRFNWRLFRFTPQQAVNGYALNFMRRVLAAVSDTQLCNSNTF